MFIHSCVLCMYRDIIRFCRSFLGTREHSKPRVTFKRTIETQLDSCGAHGLANFTSRWTTCIVIRKLFFVEYSHRANALRDSSAPVIKISPVDIMHHDVTFEHLSDVT